MLHRLLSVFIVGFWLVMTYLLIRSEIDPGGSKLREVPIGHVLKTLFLHEQPSDLGIYSGSTLIGHLRVHPKSDEETGQRSLEFTGTVQVRLQPEERRRISWDGLLRMSSTYAVEQSEWGFTLHD